MGIVNVTPDSFSDGGQFRSVAEAVEHALQLVDDGAEMIDVGGESTRPYSAPVAATEELRRVMPVLEQLCPRLKVPVSIDTSKAEVAREAITAGVEIINDISGFRHQAMLELASDSGAGVCAMHMQGTPQTMQDDPRYDDVVAEVRAYLGQRQAALCAAGVDPRQICLDPGIGFGKTHQHNLTLLSCCHQLHALHAPLLVGHSRKGFIKKWLGDSSPARLHGSVAVALALANQGVQVIRVHDVAETSLALRMYEACGGIIPPNPR